MTERTCIRGDTLRFTVAHGGSTAGWTPRLELRKHPADATPLGSLEAGDGITANGSDWDIELSESVTRSLSEPGRPGLVYYQLRAAQAAPGDVKTLESGVIRIGRDTTRMGDGFADATGAVPNTLGDQGEF